MRLCHRSSVVVDWYSRNRARSRAIFRSHRSGRLLLAADRAAQSDRVLRRASAGLQRDRVPAPRARRGRRSTQRLEKLFERGIDPDSERRGRAAQRRDDGVAVARRGARLRARAPTTAIVDALDAADVRRRTVPRCSRAEGALHRARARSDAPGDAALHVASAAVRAEAQARRASAVRGRRATRRRPRVSRSASRIPAGVATLGARSRARFRSAGTTSSTSTASTSRRSTIDVLQRHQRASSSSSSRRAAIDDRELWSDEGWDVGPGRSRARIRPSGCPSAPDGERRWLWRGMFDDIPLPPAWPVYVSQAEASRLRALEGTPAADRSGVSIAPRSARRQATERAYPWGDAPPDATPRQLRFRAAGIRSRSARIPPARAPGACTTWSATAGNGRRRSSRRSPASSRWRRIPSTRPTSSTASTT